MDDNATSRRSSILKPQKQRKPLAPIDAAPEQDDTARLQRRVSFAETNVIKPFATDPEQVTVWDLTYEEKVESTDSTQSGNNIEVSDTRRETINFNDYGGEDMSLDGSLLEDQLDKSVFVSVEYEKENILEMHHKASILVAANELREHSKDSVGVFNDVSMEMTKQLTPNVFFAQNVINLQQSKCVKDTQISMDLSTNLAQQKRTENKSFAHMNTSMEMTKCLPQTNFCPMSKTIPINFSQQTEMSMEMTKQLPPNFFVAQNAINSEQSKCINDTQISMDLTTSLTQQNIIQNESFALTKNNASMEMTKCLPQTNFLPMPKTIEFPIQIETSMKMTKPETRSEYCTSNDSKMVERSGVNCLSLNATNKLLSPSMLCEQTKVEKSLTNASYSVKEISEMRNVCSEGVSQMEYTEIKDITINDNLSTTKPTGTQFSTPLEPPTLNQYKRKHEHDSPNISRKRVTPETTQKDSPYQSTTAKQPQINFKSPNSSRIPIRTPQKAENVSLSFMTPTPKKSKEYPKTPFRQMKEDTSVEMEGEAVDDSACSMRESSSELTKIITDGNYKPPPVSSKIMILSGYDDSVSFGGNIKEALESARSINISEENISLQGSEESEASNASVPETTIEDEQLKNTILEIFDVIKEKQPKGATSKYKNHKNNFASKLQQLNNNLKEIIKLDPKERFEYFDFCELSHSAESNRESMGETSRITEANATTSDGTLDTSTEEVKSIQEKIEENVERNNTCLKLTEATKGKYSFKAKNSSVLLVADVSEADGLVTNLEVTDMTSDNLKPLSKFTHRLFMKALSPSSLSHSLGNKYDILSLLDLISMTMRKLTDFEDEFKSYRVCYMMKMEEDFSVSFGVASKGYRNMCSVKIANIEKPVTHDSVTVTVELGQINEKKVKALIDECPVGLGFISEYVKKLDEYVSSLKPTSTATPLLDRWYDILPGAKKN